MCAIQLRVMINSAACRPAAVRKPLGIAATATEIGAYFKVTMKERERERGNGGAGELAGTAQESSSFNGMCRRSCSASQLRSLALYLGKGQVKRASA